MFVDTSAFVAVLNEEDDALQFALAMSSATEAFTSGMVRLETSIVLSTRRAVEPLAAMQAFDQLLAKANIGSKPLTDDVSRIAVKALDKYGKGRGHPAQLNLTDCLSYAFAKHYRVPILFKGSDFSKTDLDVAAY